MAEHHIRFDDGAAYERAMGSWSWWTGECSPWALSGLTSVCRATGHSVRSFLASAFGHG